MRLGVVSDTHGHRQFTMNAVRMLESLEVDCVLHCGDIGSTDIPECFAGWPTHFVLGNVDYPAGDYQQAIESAGLHFHGMFAELEFEGIPIAMLHSHDAKRFDDAVHSEDYRLICYGHTHKAKAEQIGNSLVLNPGAIYRASPHSIAIVDLPELKATHVTL